MKNKKDPVQTYPRLDSLCRETVIETKKLAKEVFDRYGPCSGPKRPENLSSFDAKCESGHYKEVDWWEEARKLYLEDEELSIDNVISKIHTLVCELRTDELDNLFLSILNEKIIDDLSIALLLVTWPARNYLAYRNDYYWHVYQEIEEKYGKERAIEELITLK